MLGRQIIHTHPEFQAIHRVYRGTDSTSRNVGMSDTDIAQASPWLMGIEDAMWQSTELAKPHVSGTEYLHSMDRPKEAFSATAEVFPSDCMGKAMMLQG